MSYILFSFLLLIAPFSTMFGTYKMLRFQAGNNVELIIVREKWARSTARRNI